jgi:MFS family permease
VRIKLYHKINDTFTSQKNKILLMETITNTLRDSKVARWTALAVISFTMLCGYYLTDVMAPLKPMLEKELLWNSTEYGFFTSAYGWFNVFLLMLIFGGIILDKKGVRFTGKMATMVMVFGTAIKYWAVSTHALDGMTLLGMKAQVVIAGLGFAIFGVGVEVAGITVSKIIVKWFKGKEMALAMGLEMATARLGTTLALATSVPLATALHGVSKPILVCLIMLCIGMIAFFFYTTMDLRLDKSVSDEAARSGVASEEDSFRIKDILVIVKNRGWWYIAILCVLFYSAVFPFLKYATDLMVNKFGVDQEIAGTIPSLLPFGTIILTPFFGNLYDRKGKGATIMIIGAILLIFVHTMFSIPFLKATPIAIALIIILGIGFSLVPSAMWPSVPKIIPEKQLGTAYAMIFWVQNWGLMGVPALIGWVLDKYCVTGSRLVDGVSIPNYNYTLPMIIFTCFGILALLFAFLLKAEDKKKGYGLEMPNIKQ